MRRIAGSLWSLLPSLALLVGAACSGTTEPKGRPCTAAGFAVALAPGQYVSIDPGPDSGCTVFPANGATAVEYLVVPQIATGTPGETQGFKLVGDTIHPLAVAPLEARLAELPPAQRFHTFLRLGDENAWRDRTKTLTPLRSPGSSQVSYGELRSFHVCSNLTCSAFQTAGARARAVKTKVAIFVDTLTAAGLDSIALDTLAAQFVNRLYSTDTAAFGNESDLDGNGLVIVLMTPIVNRLVSKASCEQTQSFVAGFFYGGDLLNVPNTNDGEIFYSLVPDAAATYSCAHSATQVQRIVPVTFIHEFQHMISFNEHVLVRGGPGEVLWLNEGFSHYAEELGGRTYASGTAEFSRFVIGDLFNAYTYLDSTRQHFLLPTAGIGSLEERGAAWLFVRYIVDQFAGDTSVASWNAFTRSMVRTTQVGAANVAAASGRSFTNVVTRWALTNYVSDLPAFTPPDSLEYKSWNFRATYASLNAQDAGNFPKPFPLVPTTSAGRQTNLTGTLRAGSGIYHRAIQTANSGGFTLHFQSSNGGVLPAARVPRLNVIRIQ
jgi:hypothetical protein